MREQDIRGRMIAQALFSELEKIAAQTMGEQTFAGQMQGGVQNDASASAVLQNEESPAHGVVASRINQLDPRRAVSIPVLQPPPGYVYAPELASFIPNEQDPGWMPQETAIDASKNKGWYDQGQQDVVTGQAQQQLDSQVEEDVNAQAMQQQAIQQQQQIAAMAAQQQAVRQQRQAQAAMMGKPKPAKAKKGVTIHVGR
jgi:hypothetical protein